MPNTVFSCVNLYCVQVQSMLRWPTAHTLSTNSIWCKFRIRFGKYRIMNLLVLRNKHEFPSIRHKWGILGFVCSCWQAQILTKQWQSSSRLKSTRVSWKDVVLGEIITSSKPVAHVFGCYKVWLFCCYNVWWLWNILHHLFSWSSKDCGLRKVSPPPMVL